MAGIIRMEVSIYEMAVDNPLRGVQLPGMVWYDMMGIIIKDGYLSSIMLRQIIRII